MTTILSRRPVLRTALILVALIGVIALAFIFRPKAPLESLADLVRSHAPSTDSLTTVFISASTREKQADLVYSTANNLDDALRKAQEKLEENSDSADYKDFRMDIAYGPDAANPSAVVSKLPGLTDHSYYASTENRAKKLSYPSTLSPDKVRDMLYQNAFFLNSQIQEDGKFTYGFNIITGEESSNYSTGAHAAAISALLKAYSVIGDSHFLEGAEKALDFLIGFTTVSEEHPDQAYIENASATTIDLSATALTAIALSDYQDITGNSAHSQLLRFLSNGIESMYTEEGCNIYAHEFELDLTAKKDFMDHYYDAQATYALLRTAKTLDDPKFLTSASESLATMMEIDEYAMNAPYWLALAVNKHNELSADDADKYTPPEFNVRTPEEIYENFAEPWVAMYSVSPSNALYSVFDRSYETSLTTNQSTVADLASYLDSVSAK